MKNKAVASVIVEKQGLKIDSPDALSGNLQHMVYLLHAYQKTVSRQGTASTKTRSTVRGGGAKPYKQKGTGNARRGTNRTPLRRGGSVIFGPRPRIFSTKLNAKLVKEVFKSAFILKKDAITILNADDVAKFTTKEAVGLVGENNVRRMYIGHSDEDVFSKAFRNLENFEIVSEKNIPILNFLNSDSIYVSSAIVPSLERCYLK